MTTMLAQRLCDFIDASPTAFHATDSIATDLESRGARFLDERSDWKLEPGALYFTRRAGSSLIAFRPGLEPPAAAGFAVAGAHTDSPGLKARLGKSLSGKGLERVPVEVYGNPIISTWMDRPLSLAGRVVLRSPGSSAASYAGTVNRTETRLVKLARPIGVIPNLAIHLNREINKGFEYNAQGQLPVLVAALPTIGLTPSETDGVKAGGSETSWLHRLISRELGVDPGAILGADLFFVDAQKVCLMGTEEELVNGYRLDDLLGCHAVLEGFLASEAGSHTQVACFLDNEEVGSRTAQGADSAFLRDVLSRINALSVSPSFSYTLSESETENFYRALASSFNISVDVAQAFHPSYAEKFDEGFVPVLNGGPAIKANANFKYATDAASEAAFRLLCEESGVTYQKFMSRADMVPGSTIGPMSASLTGILTVDIGHPLLSMHSARETAGVRDHEGMVAVLARHFTRGPRR